MTDPQNITDAHSISPPIALLCLGDVTEHEQGGISPLTPIFGKPLIHHIIKRLEKAGISRFCIGVDTVPGALLHYRDTAATDGMDIQFVRDASALAQHYGRDAQILVLQWDVLWTVSAMADFLRDGTARIAAVEERPENHLYERIDLNNRWGGLAVVTASTLEPLSQLPDGWDMASAVLRQAVQDGVPMIPVKQSILQSGDIQKLVATEDLLSIQRYSAGNRSRQSDDLEQRLWARPAAALLPHIWSVPWGRAVAQWAFPLFAALSALLAATGFAVAASAVSIFALFAGYVRRSVRLAEYRPGGVDAVDIISFAALAAALFAGLHMAQPVVTQSVFLTLTVTGLAVLSSRLSNGRAYTFLSPLTIALALLFGIALDAADLAVQLLILCEIGHQLWRVFRPSDKIAPAD